MISLTVSDEIRLSTGTDTLGIDSTDIIDHTLLTISGIDLGSVRSTLNISDEITVIVGDAIREGFVSQATAICADRNRRPGDRSMIIIDSCLRHFIDSRGEVEACIYLRFNRITLAMTIDSNDTISVEAGRHVSVGERQGFADSKALSCGKSLDERLAAIYLDLREVGKRITEDIDIGSLERHLHLCGSLTGEDLEVSNEARSRHRRPLLDRDIIEI